MKNAIFKTPLTLAVILSLTLFGAAFGQMVDLEFQSESVISGEFTNMVMFDLYAYCASAYGLTVLDFTDPTDPQVVAVMPTEGICHDVDVDAAGNYAYLADDYMGVHIVNIMDPTDPFIVSTVDLEANARALDYGDDKVFVAMEEDGIAMINVLDPSLPVLLDTYDTDDRAFEIKYADNYVYVADLSSVTSFGTTGDQFSDPVDTYAGDSYIALTLNETDMYVANGEDGVDIFELIGSGEFDYVATAEDIYAWDVAPLGDNVIVGGGVRVILIDNTGTQLGGYSGTVDDVMGVFGYSTVLFDIIVTMEGFYGAEIIDATIPTSMTLLAYLPYEGGPRNIVVSEVLDVIYAFIANHLGGVCIMDVTDPTDPQEVTVIPLEGWTYDVELVGTMLYICEFYFGIYAYDVTNPEEPQYVTEFPIPPEGNRALASNGVDYLISVNYDYGIYKFDISDPTAIVWDGSQATHGKPRDVEVDPANDLAFVADYTEDMTGGATIFDVSTTLPTLPIELSVYNMERVRSVDFLGNYMYVGSELEGMDIVDISDPEDPLFVSNYETVGDVNGLTVIENLDLPAVIASCWANGVEVIGATDPTNPVQNDYYDTHSYGKAAYVYENQIYFADSYSLYIFTGSVGVDPESPSAFVPDNYALMQNFPNPFNPETSLIFHMKNPGNITLTVYDIQGREVTRLAEGWYGAGVHEVSFDAANLPSGTYFANFKAEGFSQTCKMLLIK